MGISIVYEDKNLMVLNKPAGLIVHPKNADDIQESVTSWLIEHYPYLKDVGEPFIASGTPAQRAGVVHRLDKDTSGLLVVAKTDEAFLYLKNLFQTRQIHKSYQALVYGRPKESPGIISAPMGRIGLKRTTELFGKKKLSDQKEAVTEYSIIKSFKKYVLLDVSPKTGRTHQIRVHLKSIGCPIVGDPVYAPKGWSRLAPSESSASQSRIRDSRGESGPHYIPEGLNRLFLHAYKLSFTTPDGKSLTLECDLPPDLQKVLTMLE